VLVRLELVLQSIRLILYKAGKAILIANTQLATLKANNKRLKYQLDQLGSQRKRKRIYIDPNIRFTDIEKIKGAIDQAAIEAANSSAKSTEKAAAAAVAAAGASTLQNMCTKWQL
jgi:peptidoglycan hydrolase CwlO-like protein